MFTSSQPRKAAKALSPIASTEAVRVDFPVITQWAGKGKTRRSALTAEWNSAREPERSAKNLDIRDPMRLDRCPSRKL